ncbi:B3 domain-containing protein Os01g0723500-like isoform X1 [Asparagus officinalis]|uniref:B3 domain-containing protein Os01g0723500-like isoform X1 n=1 Tax=Asparagus officinalis TaxID=4686 RepID=UPI00098DEFED|nr:B3 domain-containing protein Os01g0723500-like isoform X1 [Asparagus officinalis]
MGNPKSMSILDRPSFFKVMIGDFTCSLRIPPEFKKHLGETITQRPVVIRSSQGRRWRIKLGIVGGNLYFRDGWERFVSASSVTEGDFLVFFYDGDFGFDVIIYGTTCCSEERVNIPGERDKIEAESEDSDEEEPGSRREVRRKRKPKKMTNNSKCFFNYC